MGKIKRKIQKLNGFLTIAEAAKRIGKTRFATYQRIRRNKIPTEQVGHILLISEADFQKYLA